MKEYFTLSMSITDWTRSIDNRLTDHAMDSWRVHSWRIKDFIVYILLERDWASKDDYERYLTHGVRVES